MPKALKTKQTVNDWATQDMPLLQHLNQAKAKKEKDAAKSLQSYTLPKPHPGAQEKFINTEASVCIYGGSAGGGKGGASYGMEWAFNNIAAFTSDRYNDIASLVPQEIRQMDTKVLMWNGDWREFSELVVGDRIMNPDGQAQKILQIHERKTLPIFTVKFEDNTSVKCDGDHLWGFWEARADSRSKTRSGYKPILPTDESTAWSINYISRARVRDTTWLKNAIKAGRRFIVPISAPLNYTHISRGREDRAWLYGALLGDGMILPKSEGGIILTTIDEWIKERCLNLVEKYSINPKQRTDAIGIRLMDEWVRNWAVNNGLLGKHSHNKFIPPGYLKESLDFRWNLAQGLFDTDGYASTVAKNEVSYCTTSPQLAEDVANLVRSLGFMAKVRQKQDVCYNPGYEGEKRMAYIVAVEGNDRHKLFSLPRKIEAAKAHEPNIWVGKRITSIEENGETYCRCITVANPNRLYITDDYNVTHNSFCLLLKAAQNIDNPGYGSVIFRRTAPEITNEGGLWDESLKIYRKIPGARSREGNLDWIFPSGAAISFGHAQYEKDVEDKYPGAQIAHLGFDELTKFTEKQFWFLFSRNRSTSGVVPRIDATCNPDADSWVAKLIDWWIDPITGYPIPERGGVLRYFYRVNGVLHWGDSPEELEEKFPHLAEIAPPKSLTFIPAVLDDNRTLMEADPQYKANLLALHPVEMERLLKGNWKIKFSAGLVFNRKWFEIIEPEDIPNKPGVLIRFWDLASTAREVATSSSCFSASQKWLRIGDIYYVLDCYWEQLGAEAGDDQIISLSIADGNNCKVRWELEGGSAARRHEASLIKKIHEVLPKVDCRGVQPLGDKLTRAKPWATSARAGQVKIVRAWWNDDFLGAVDAFDGSKKTPPINDIVDAGSGAWVTTGQSLVFGGGLGDNR